MRPGALVVIAAGSSAALVLPAYLAELRRDLAGELVVLLTKSAERFVSPNVVGWFADEVLTYDCPSLNPVEVALTARSIVVLPATAHILAATALGLASTPATTALFAAPQPCLWLPHMNKVMWDKPVIQRHVATLRDSGHTIVEPKAREIYEIWRGAPSAGISMPSPNDAAAIVHAWLANTLMAPLQPTPATPVTRC